jgi:glutamine cyclotransferase
MIPHDPGAFTQGFEIHDGYLWESAGRYGQSSFRKTDIETGEVIAMLRLPDSVFAEGFTFVNDSTVYLLTWKEHTVFIINPWTMGIQNELFLNTEGWGICNTGTDLAQSDGSSILRFRSISTFTVIDSVSVTLNGQPQSFLNELEYVDGLILANQWGTDRILFINPDSGIVERFITLGSVRPSSGGVLNGIALNQNGTIYCTGKNWPVTLLLNL